MLEENFKHKVFVTGIFGSGKTYFSKRFVADNPEYCFIDFDHGYNYSSRDLDPVYNKMKGREKFIIDALPLNGSSESMAIFKDYLLKNSCTLVLIKCHIDTWLERLPSKTFYDKEKIEEYNKSYQDFYGAWVHDILLSTVLDGNTDNMIIHDSTE